MSEFSWTFKQNKFWLKADKRFKTNNFIAHCFDSGYKTFDERTLAQQLSRLSVPFDDTLFHIND